MFAAPEQSMITNFFQYFFVRFMSEKKDEKFHLPRGTWRWVLNIFHAFCAAIYSWNMYTMLRKSVNYYFHSLAKQHVLSVKREREREWFSGCLSTKTRHTTVWKSECLNGLSCSVVVHHFSSSLLALAVAPVYRKPIGSETQATTRIESQLPLHDSQYRWIFQAYDFCLACRLRLTS